jgi:hypothetical protein
VCVLDRVVEIMTEEISIGFLKMRIPSRKDSLRFHDVTERGHRGILRALWISIVDIMAEHLIPHDHCINKLNNLFI